MLNSTEISKCEVWRPLSQHVDIRPATVTKGSRRFRGFAFRSRRLTGHEFAPMPHHLQGLETHLECWNKAAQTSFQNMWKNSHVALKHTEKKWKTAIYFSTKRYGIQYSEKWFSNKARNEDSQMLVSLRRFLAFASYECEPFFFPITALECWSLSNWIFHHWTIELPSYKLSCSRPLTSNLPPICHYLRQKGEKETSHYQQLPWSNSNVGCCLSQWIAIQAELFKAYIVLQCLANRLNDQTKRHRVPQCPRANGHTYTEDYTMSGLTGCLTWWVHEGQVYFLHFWIFLTKSFLIS